MQKSTIRKTTIATLILVLCLSIAFNPILSDSPITDSVFTVGTQIEDVSYVLFKDGSTYYAKNGDSGNIKYSGSNATYIINSALADLTPSRTWREKVVLKGYFTIDQSIIIDSYTIFELHGKIQLANNINKTMIKNKDQVNGNTYISIIGGYYDGNRANNGLGHIIHFQANSPNTCGPIHIKDTTLYQASEYGIYLNRVAQPHIEQNIIKVCGKEAIYYQSGWDGYIAFNDAYYNNQLETGSCEVHFRTISGTRLECNKIGGTKESCVMLYDSERNTITDNIIYDASQNHPNTYHLLHIYCTSHGNIVSGNEFHVSTSSFGVKYGVLIYSDDNRENIVDSNGFYTMSGASFGTAVIYDLGNKSRITNNIGFNPVGKKTNPFDTTNDLIEFYGDSASPEPSTDYVIYHCDILISSTDSGNSDCDILIKDKNGNQINPSALSSLDAYYVPVNAPQFIL